MAFFRFLLRGSWLTIAVSVIVGVIAAAASLGLIRMIHHTIRGRHAPSDTMMYEFIGLAVIVLITRVISQVIMSRFAQRTASTMLRHLSRQVLRVPLRNLEEFGTQRLQKILTKDVQIVGAAIKVIPNVCIKSTMLVCGIGYMIYLSPKLFGSLALFAGLGGGAYYLMSRRGRRLMRESREDQGALMRHVRQLIRGLKELKLHRQRQDAFLDKGIGAADAALRERQISGQKLNAVSSTFGRFLFLAAIGLVLFLWPKIEEMSGNDLFIFGFILLFLMRQSGSLTGNVNLLFGKARGATRRLQMLGVTERNLEEEGLLLAGEPVNPNWERMELVAVTHSYNREGPADFADEPPDDPAEEVEGLEGGAADIDVPEPPRREGEENNFVLGPINLTLNRGEITFIVGGNGSGKTTLIKVLCGLYTPELGEIRLDGQVIDLNRRESYRQLFTGVFDEVVLFENLYGVTPEQVDERARQYLTALHLDREVTITDGKFSTTEALSKGQRKRLGLIAAYLEDRPIYVFDEWAANQDPLFKRVFYTQILPDIKARGRTVVAVTHDDNYFHCADRIIVLRDGRVVAGDWRDNLIQQRGRLLAPAAPAANGAPAGGEAALAGAGENGTAGDFH
jgi:putative pyoverdin transport system ATP-binding/permease protein